MEYRYSTGSLSKYPYDSAMDHGVPRADLQVIHCVVQGWLDGFINFDIGGRHCHILSLENATHPSPTFARKKQ